VKDPRSGIAIHLAALDAGFAPWLPILHTREDVHADIYEDVLWDLFQADYPELFTDGAA
jgi:hypothetical protein